MLIHTSSTQIARGKRHDGEAEPAWLGLDTQAAQQAPPGILCRPGPATALRGAHLHPEDRRRALAGRRAPTDRAQRVDATGSTAGPKTARAVTVGEYAQRWIEHRSLKPLTRKGYQALLDRHITPTIGAVALTDLTPEMVRGWHASLDPKHPTINAHAYGLLHAVLATAVSDELLLTNPCHPACDQGATAA